MLKIFSDRFELSNWLTCHRWVYLIQYWSSKVKRLSRVILGLSWLIPTDSSILPTVLGPTTSKATGRILKLLDGGKVTCLVSTGHLFRPLVGGSPRLQMGGERDKEISPDRDTVTGIYLQTTWLGYISWQHDSDISLDPVTGIYQASSYKGWLL